jgi:hypothetical protein
MSEAEEGTADFEEVVGLGRFKAVHNLLHMERSQAVEALGVVLPQSGKVPLSLGTGTGGVVPTVRFEE